MIIYEAMYSDIYELSQNPEELLLRLHPNKRESYNAMMDGSAQIENAGKKISIKDIYLRVNSGTKDLNVKYSEIYQTPISQIKNTHHVKGFDATGEPIIYEMNDGTLRVVFSQLPPTNPRGGRKLNLDKLSFEFTFKIGCGITHDDREVFHVPNPNENTVKEIMTYLSEYRKK